MAASNFRPARNKKEKLLRLIECPVCLNELQDPRLLSCRHTLCYQCMKDYKEKGCYNTHLPCPVCRAVTRLNQGGVDSLPQFFFMNELKEVVKEQDDDKPKLQGGAVCSVDNCGKAAVKYCKNGCQFMCQQCYSAHQSFKMTNHNVISAGQDTLFKKSRPMNFIYSSCNRHRHQIVDLYCRTCRVPVCSICFNSIHKAHDHCRLDKQAELCKSDLEQIREDTDDLIDVAKEAVHKTKQQVKQAEKDINGACDKVKLSFKILHGKLDKEEANILSDLERARGRMRTQSESTEDNQMITLAKLESIKSSQMKMAAMDCVDDYVSVAESVRRDLEDHYGQQLPGFTWKCQFVRKNRGGDGCPSGKVEITSTEKQYTNGNKGDMKEIGRFPLPNSQHNVQGLAVFNGHIFTVHLTNFIVYCFASNGELYSKYRHDVALDVKTMIQGMCLIVDGNKAMLVISDWSHNSLVWIRIKNDFTMIHHRTQQLDYGPRGAYHDRGRLMICDYDNSKVYRYSSDGKALDVISLPSCIDPWRLIRYGDCEQYVIVDYVNQQLVMIDNKGRVKKRYKDEVQGVKMGHPRGIMRDAAGRILVSDESENQVLLMNKEGDMVMESVKLQHVTRLGFLCLDDLNQRLYVSGRDHADKNHVFIYDYSQFSPSKTFTDLITQFDLMVEI